MRTIWLAEERRRIEQLKKEASSVPDFLEEELEMFQEPWPSSPGWVKGKFLERRLL
jgi:hypothetical protein